MTPCVLRANFGNLRGFYRRTGRWEKSNRLRLRNRFDEEVIGRSGVIHQKHEDSPSSREEHWERKIEVDVGVFSIPFATIAVQVIPETVQSVQNFKEWLATLGESPNFINDLSGDDDFGQGTPSL